MKVCAIELCAGGGGGEGSMRPVMRVIFLLRRRNNIIIGGSLKMGGGVAAASWLCAQLGVRSAAISTMAPNIIVCREAARPQAHQPDVAGAGRMRMSRQRVIERSCAYCIGAVAAAFLAWRKSVAR